MLYCLWTGIGHLVISVCTPFEVVKLVGPSSLNAILLTPSSLTICSSQLLTVSNSLASEGGVLGGRASQFWRLVEGFWV